MTELEKLETAVRSFCGIDKQSFALSLPYWELRTYHKGEYYNEYRNVCKHLGFIVNGVFRTYYVNAETGEEKNMLFYTTNQMVTAFKSFLTRRPCNFYTESMVESTILYIHVDHLQALYKQSHEWERFGRYIAEVAFNLMMEHTEDFLFKSPEERYVQMVEQHPDLVNQVPLYHIASYLGIAGPSLSRIRKRMQKKN